MNSGSPNSDVGLTLAGSPHLAGRQMSSSLKEKLKKMGRSRISPLASPAVTRRCNTIGDKSSVRSAVRPTSVQNSTMLENRADPDSRPKLEHLERNEILQPEDVATTAVDYERSNDLTFLQTYKKTLETRILQQRESVRKLELAKLYRTKNDLLHLDRLIEKWRQVSQDGIQELHNGMPDPKPSLTQLINYLQIDHELIGYIAEEESFKL